MQKAGLNRINTEIGIDNVSGSARAPPVTVYI